MSSLIGSALLASLLAAAPEPSSGRDSDEAVAPSSETMLDRVLVTGSRIPRIDLEGPLPISVVEREELRVTGALNLADALRDLPFNSFGSFGDAPNSSLPTVSVPSLRGLGGKYTLVLLDGHRLPGVAQGFSGGASSLTGIPMSAIDRIEVLRDGASAVYGSDAIGGVLNLRTRRAATGAEVELLWEAPSGAGGDARRASIVSGGGDDRSGDWLLALEWLDREPLAGAQRPYLLDAATTSFSGNPGSFQRLDPTTGRPLGFLAPDPRCPAAFDVDPQFPNSRLQAIGNSRVCGYRFRAENFERAGLESLSLFTRGGIDTRSGLRLDARLMALRSDSLTQLAAAPTSLIVPADAPGNPTLGERGPGLGFPLRVQYRLTPLGPRISASREDQLHLLLGMRGDLDWADGGDWSLALVENRYNERARSVSGSARLSVFTAAVASGRFDPFSALPGDPTGLEDARYAARDDSESGNRGLEGNVSLDTSWFDRPFALAFGFEVRRDRFGVRNDPVRQAGDIIGSSIGVDQSGGRRYAAVHAELLHFAGDTVEIGVAARYDRYQDAGSALSPKLSVAWRPTPAHLLRASAGRGFQAPDLSASYGGIQDSLGIARDLRDCAASGGDPLACALQLFPTSVVPNPQLAPERARQAGVGWVWQPSDGFDLALDYYRTRIVDQVEVLPPQLALEFELACVQAGRTCDPLTEGSVLRTPSGLIERVLLPRINQALLRTQGLDLELGARRDTRLGEFGLRLGASRVLDFDTRVRGDGAVDDRLGRFGTPRWRGTLALDWQRGAHALRLGARHNRGFPACFAPLDFAGNPDPNCAIQVGSHTEIDAQWRWTPPWSGELAIGGRNLADRPLPIGPTGEVAYGLHDPIGRVWYLRYQHRF